MSISKRLIAAGAVLLTVAGAGSAAFAATSYTEGGYAYVPSTRTSITAKDTAGDDNRIYAEWYQNNDTAKRQIVTKAYNQSVTQYLGPNKVVRFQACVDKPWSGDSCAGFIKL